MKKAIRIGVKNFTATSKITIAIPVYNVEKYLSACLDSIVNQTLTDIEIICVNDGSTDNSARILEKYAGLDSRIKIIHHKENMSLTCARKTGVEAASSKYIMFVDSDDYLDLQACEVLYDRIEKEKVDILHFGTTVHCVGAQPREEAANAEHYFKLNNLKLNGKQILLKCFKENAYCHNVWGKLYSTKMCKKAYDCIDWVRITRSEDRLAYFLLSYYAKSYLGVNEYKFYHYNFGYGDEGRGSVTLDSFKKQCESVLVSQLIEKFVNTKGQLSSYDGICEKIVNDDCNYTMFKWLQKLESKESAAGFDCMMATWKPEVLIENLYKSYRWQQGNIASRMYGSKLFTAPLRKIKTIAMLYYRYYNGGVERVISKQLQWFINLGYNVVLITEQPESENDYLLPDGVKRAIIPPFTESSLERTEALTELIHKENIDCVLYHQWEDNNLLFDMLICKFCNTAFIIHAHNIFSYRLVCNDSFITETTQTFALADGMIVLSETDKAFWSRYNTSVHQVQNPLTYEKGETVRVELKTKIVLSISRFDDHQKQPFQLLEAFALIAKRIPEAKLFMVGDISEYKRKDEFLAEIAKQGLSDRVILCGYHTEVSTFIRMASVFISTSRYEGFPMTLSEVMAFGVPAVMYKLPYLTMTQHNDGIIAVKMNSPELIAQAVVELLTDDVYLQEKGKAAFEYVEQLNDYDYLAKWQEIFSLVTTNDKVLHRNASDDLLFETFLEHYTMGVRFREEQVSWLESLRNDSAQEKIDYVWKEREYFRTEMERARGEAEFFGKEIEGIRSSLTYRVGDMVTWLPKKMLKRK